jgi:hypothetical protein
MKATKEANPDSAVPSQSSDDPLALVSEKRTCLEMEVVIDLPVHEKAAVLPLPTLISPRMIGMVVNIVPATVTKVPSTIARIMALAKLEFWWMKMETDSMTPLNTSKNDEVAIQPTTWLSLMRIANLDQALHRPRTRTKSLLVTRARRLKSRSLFHRSPI